MPLTNQLILSYFSAGVGRTVLKRNQKTKNQKKSYNVMTFKKLQGE